MTEEMKPLLIQSFLFLASVIICSYGARTYSRGNPIVIPNRLIRLQSGVHEILFKDRASINVTISNKNDCRKIDVMSDNSICDESLSGLIIQVIRHSIDAYGAKDSTIICDGLSVTTVKERSSEEMVDWICDEGTVLCPLSRVTIHKHNLLHRGIGAIIYNRNSDEIFVHQRAPTKRIFPSMYDMFIGGVSSSGEAPIETLMRELLEEIGIDLAKANDQQATTAQEMDRDKPISKSYSMWSKSPAAKNAWQQFQTTSQYAKLFPKSSATSANNIDLIVAYIGRTTIYTDYNHCLVDCYFVNNPSKEIIFADGEIQSGTWMAIDKLNTFIQKKYEQFVPDGLLVWKALPTLK